MIYSQQRELIMDALKSSKEHPTADELYSAVRGNGISLATVYRNLNQLVDCGRVMRIAVPHGADRFDPVNDGHFHMTCEVCGSISDIPQEAVPDICGAVRENTGMDIRSERILFYGVCNACKHKNK